MPLLDRILPCLGALALLLPPASAQSTARAPAPPLTGTDLLDKIDSVDGANDPSVTADPTGPHKVVKAGAAGKAGAGMQADGPTVITAMDTEFHQKLHEAIFQTQVVVNNANFNLVCDKLTAYLRHTDAARPAGQPDGDEPPPKATPAPSRSSSGKAAAAAAADKGPLDHAIGEGACIISQDKMDDNGNITHSVGHGKKVIYDAVQGKFTLYGKPDIQQGENLCVALDEKTVMVLNRNGQMEAFGPHRTVIVENQEPDKAGAGKAAAK